MIITELDTLDGIETTSSKKGKELLLIEASCKKRLFELLNAAFNFKRKFYIKKFDAPAVAMKPECGQDRHDDFMTLLDTLESGVIRGDAAKNAVIAFLDGCTELQQKWYTRVIRKDLKAGFSISTANKAGFNIPRFEVMLAKDGKLSKKLDELILKGGFVSKKFDGYRCLTEVVDGVVTMYSRNGTEYENFPSIVESLKLMFPVGKYIFDGEIMSDDFQSMQRTAFAGKKGRTVGDVKYHIFDFIPYSEWESSKFKILKTVRDRLLKETFIESSLLHSGCIPDNLVVVDQAWVNSKTEIMELERKFIEEGYEGAMFLPDIPYYVGKKSNKMLKFKTMVSQDVEILGFYLGKPGSSNEHRLGGVTVRQEDGLECDCGSGFSHESRDYIWNHQDKFLGRIFEACYQELGSGGKMRFPVFKRWRDDKSKK